MYLKVKNSACVTRKTYFEVLGAVGLDGRSGLERRVRRGGNLQACQCEAWQAYQGHDCPFEGLRDPGLRGDPSQRKAEMACSIQIRGFDGCDASKRERSWHPVSRIADGVSQGAVAFAWRGLPRPLYFGGGPELPIQPGLERINTVSGSVKARLELVLL